MIYRKNEKGRYEAVTDKGEVISFEDEAEMFVFVKMRNEVLALVGREPEDPGIALSVTLGDSVSEVKDKKVKTTIHSGEYIVDGLRLKKKKALA